MDREYWLELFRDVHFQTSYTDYVNADWATWAERRLKEYAVSFEVDLPLKSSPCSEDERRLAEIRASLEMADHWNEPELLDRLGHRITDNECTLDDAFRQTAFFLLYRLLEKAR